MTSRQFQDDRLERIQNSGPKAILFFFDTESAIKAANTCNEYLQYTTNTDCSYVVCITDKQKINIKVTQSGWSSHLEKKFNKF